MTLDLALKSLIFCLINNRSFFLVQLQVHMFDQPMLSRASDHLDAIYSVSPCHDDDKVVMLYNLFDNINAHKLDYVVFLSSVHRMMLLYFEQMATCSSRAKKVTIQSSSCST